MTVELKVPSVGESITEVQIGDWLVPEGQAAQKDEALVVIETDKVTVELPAPVAGTVSRVLKKKGDKAAVGEVIGYMEEGAAPAKAKAAKGKEPAPPAKTEAAKSKEPAPAAKVERAPAKVEPATTKAESAAARAEPAPDETESAPDEAEAASAKTGEARVMPSARRAMHEKGLKPEDVKGSGPGGRVTKEDTLRAPPPIPAATAAAPSAPLPKSPAPGADRFEEVVPMTPMRKRIAERLVQAKQNAALLTTFNEIDMSAVIALRKEHQEAFQQRHGTKLGLMSFFVKAAIEALKLVPQVNAEVRGDSIVYKNHYDIGVAVGGGKGLVVPVLRNAERMSFAEVEIAIADFGKRAQENKLTLEELQGGTFTISNGGIYGSLLSTPIVNPPQSGILGLHAIQERPVAREGQVVIRPMMYVAVTYDHRIVDGREAVGFLKRIKECVEAPARMLLET